MLLRLKEEKMTEVVMVRRGRRTRMRRRKSRWKRLPTLNPPLQRVNEFSWQQIIILVVPPKNFGISTKSSN